MTNLQVDSQVAIGSFSWEIWGINSLCFHLKNPTKPRKNLSLNTVKLKKWSKSQLAPTPSFLQPRPLPLSLLKAVPNCSSMIWVRSFSGLQPLIQICGGHSPVMNPISFILLLLGVRSLRSHTGKCWHVDTRERPKGKDFVPPLLFGAARWLKLFYIPCSWLCAL